MDLVVIEALRVEAIIGVHPWERKVRQPLVLDLELAADAGKSALADDLADALDYEALARRVADVVEASRFELLESLAEHVAGVVREEFDVPWLRLRLAKPAALRAAGTVGVVIERGERPA